MSLENPLNHLRPGMRVYIPGGTGEPGPLIEALIRDPERARGVTFIGIWIPGINQFDFAGLHPEARSEVIFLPPHLQDSFHAGHIKVHPFGYRRAWDWLRDETRLDLAFLTTTPAQDGLFSAGICPDFAGAILASNCPVVALVNSEMPRPADGLNWPQDRAMDQIECPFTLANLADGASDPAIEAIADLIAPLIQDGDVLQFGIGRIPAAILPRLRDRRNLRIHSGMIVNQVLDLIDSGAIPDLAGQITSGLSMGNPGLYARAASDKRFRFRGVDFTHDHSVLAAIPNLVTLNSGLEVDLNGQVNAVYIGAKQISGTGGLADFAAGASSAPNGRGFIALEATAKSGTISRIVPRFHPGTIPTVPAEHASFIVTQFGMADLRGKFGTARADALIAIADPRHREMLVQSLR
jgi:acyl-CoA hydrolase